MTRIEEVHFDFSEEELWVLGELLGDRPFPGVPATVIDGLSAKAREAALATARRGLVAREIVSVHRDDAGVSVAPPFDALFFVVLSPGLIVRVGHYRPERNELRLYYARPELGVEQSIADGTIHRLTPFETGQLVERIASFTGLQPTPPPDQEHAFTITAGALRTYQERARDGKPLDLDGFPPEGEAFLEAMRTVVSSSEIHCLGTDAGTISGGDLAWIDAGEGGLWLLERDTAEAEDPGDDDPVQVRKTSAEELATTLLAYLPRHDELATSDSA